MNALKAALREQVKAHLAVLSEEQRAARSAELRARLLEQPIWRKAQSILMYAPVSGEADVWPLLATGLQFGKRVALPRFDPMTRQYVGCQVTNPSQDLVLGRYGIREPAVHCESIALNQLDFVLVPGVAFDLHGRRLGRGKGYYDRMLAEVRGQTCGVAFDEQIVREVPISPHDSDVNCILTPTRWIEL
ncbi:MAG TPA: 5-formyltetrahydrofolate cyclo-ligase [Verrucomicrobiae bacterium]|nr:5-formyltetrahydrofolate cyclo-ligase [Verrucomicrobiae bacterium]